MSTKRKSAIVLFLVMPAFVVGAFSLARFLKAHRQDQAFGRIHQSLATNADVANLRSKDVADALQLLVPEMEAIVKAEKKNPELGGNRHERFQDVVFNLGSNLAPVIPKLREMYLSDRCPGPALTAFRACEELGLPIIIEGLYSTNSRLQAGSLDSLTIIRADTPPEAMHRILTLATNGNETVRLLAAGYLGNKTNFARLKIPCLIYLLTHDTNQSVRNMSAKSLRNYHNLSQGEIEVLKHFPTDHESKYMPKYLSEILEAQGQAPGAEK